MVVTVVCSVVVVVVMVVAIVVVVMVVAIVGVAAFVAVVSLLLPADVIKTAGTIITTMRNTITNTLTRAPKTL